jgi:hypothetical protein
MLRHEEPTPARSMASFMPEIGGGLTAILAFLHRRFLMAIYVHAGIDQPADLEGAGGPARGDDRRCGPRDPAGQLRHRP